MGNSNRELTASSAVASNAAVVTPADGADLPIPATKGIWVGVAGDVKVDTMGGQTVIFKAPVGLLRVQAKRVYATLTTATNMVALW